MSTILDTLLLGLLAGGGVLIFLVAKECGSEGESIGSCIFGTLGGLLEGIFVSSDTQKEIAAKCQGETGFDKFACGWTTWIGLH